MQERLTIFSVFFPIYFVRFLKKQSRVTHWRHSAHNRIIKFAYRLLPRKNRAMVPGPA